ncbi:hypothetical protein [Taibaiella koreensis]|uniref:hypothetical protein n=1 Tax=Taibaiella koreensis TaxID=1268548 RepID=UPI0013C33187|nr:hypothetical protein [Taibaiella koreensis]
MMWKWLTTSLWLLGQGAYAQQPDFDIREHSMYLPAPQRPGKYDHSITLAQIYLPDQWLEQPISGPMIDYKANYALPGSFALNGNVKTLVLANDVRLGPSWSYSLSDQLHISVGYQLGFSFGFLRSFGYNNTIRVWEHHPILRAGFNFKNIAFTFQGKLDWMINTRLGLQDYATSNITGSMFNGYSIACFIEQRLTRRHSICFGFIAGFNKFHILGWPALMIVDHQYFIPEINIGFKL